MSEDAFRSLWKPAIVLGSKRYYLLVCRIKFKRSIVPVLVPYSVLAAILYLEGWGVVWKGIVPVLVLVRSHSHRLRYRTCTGSLKCRTGTVEGRTEK